MSTEAFKKPPPLPCRSIITSFIPCSFSDSIASMNSLYVFAPKLPRRTYPMPSEIIYEASSDLIGILSRVTLNLRIPSAPRLFIPSSTLLPFLPLRRFIMSIFDIFTPAITVSLTDTMRSPGMIPTFSDGPLTTGWITMRVSSTILNCMPIPSKFPIRGSVRDFISSGLE